MHIIPGQESVLQTTASEVGKGFTKGDGPFVRGLEAALKSFNVQRQAYYSGTFVGNHVHRTLKVIINGVNFHSSSFTMYMCLI